jgi:tRNA(Arg) A34 adenosine deaminase TadA
MYWENLELPWKEAFLQGWIAFCNGSVPIGSVICDQNGEILSKARNHIYENYFPNNKVAHAETIAVQSLDLQLHNDPHSYIVYACVEPCPMCFGTIVMGNIRTIKIAARDAYAGAVEIAELSQYVKSKKMEISFEPGLLGAVQVTMQSYFELKNNPERSKPLHDKIRIEYNNSLILAKELLDINYFENAIARSVPFSSVFEEIYIKLAEMNSKGT